MSKQYSDSPEAPDIESSTADYATRFAGDSGKWFLKMQDRGTKKLINKLMGGRPFSVLDVGGGHGQNVQVLRQMGADITVVGSTEACSTLLQDDIEKGHIKFVTGNLKQLPFADAEFDVVISYRIMAHIDDCDLLAKELCRVASKLVLVDYSSTRSVNVISDLLYVFKKSLEKNTRKFRLHSPAEMRQSFKAAGAYAFSSFSQYFFPMALHRALAKPGLSKLLEAVARAFGLTHFFGSPVIGAYLVNKDLKDE